MRESRLVVLALASVLLLLSISAPELIQASGPEPTDCSNLLILLEKSLDAVVSVEPNTTYLLSSVSKVVLSGDLSVYHVNAYKTLSKYYEYLVRVLRGTISRNETQRTLVELANLQSELPNTINQYVSKLSSCSHDPSFSVAIRARVSLKVGKIVDEEIPHLLELVLREYATQEALNIELSSDVFHAGETAKLRIAVASNTTFLSSVRVVTWPGLSNVLDIANVTFTNGAYLAEFRVPGLKSLTGVAARNEEKYSFIVVAVARDLVSGSTYVGYKTFKVIYRKPDVRIDAPSSIQKGDLLTLNIYSDGTYNASLKFSDVFSLNITLAPGVSNYYINTSQLNLSTGLYPIKVFVEPTDETLGLTLTKNVLVSSKIPKVGVGLSNPFFSSDCFLTLTLINGEQSSTLLYAKVYVGGSLVGEYVLEDSISARIFVGVLPASIIDLRVVIESSSPVMEPYVFSSSVLVFNPVTTALLGFASLALIVVISGREENFMFFVRGLIPEGRVTRVFRKTLSEVLTAPYKISSKIAELYYATLQKMRVPLPEAYETLREHFRKTAFREPLRSVFWKFLLLVEKDLYSSRKQSYEDAVTLAEEAVKHEDQ